MSDNSNQNSGGMNGATGAEQNPELSREIISDNYFEQVNGEFEKALLTGKIGPDAIKEITKRNETSFFDWIVDAVKNPQEAFDWGKNVVISNLAGSWLGEIFGLKGKLSAAKDKLMEYAGTPLKILGGVFVGLSGFAILKKLGLNVLNPASLVSSAIKKTFSGAGSLLKLGGGVAIRVAALGAVVYGAVKLYEYFTDDPSRAHDMPQDKGAQREWWKNKLMELKIDDEAQSLLTLLMGEEEAKNMFADLEQDAVAAGVIVADDEVSDVGQIDSMTKDGVEYERLDSVTAGLKKDLSDTMRECTQPIRENKNSFIDAAVVASLVSESARGALLSAGSMTAGGFMSFAKLPFIMIGDLPLVSLAGIMGVLALVKGNPLVPKDVDNLSIWLKDKYQMYRGEIEPEVRENVDKLKDEHYGIFAKLMLGIDNIRDYIGEGVDVAEEFVDKLVYRSLDAVTLDDTDLVNRHNFDTLYGFDEGDLDGMISSLDENDTVQRTKLEKLKSHLGDMVKQAKAENRTFSSKEVLDFIAYSAAAGVKIENKHGIYTWMNHPDGKERQLFVDPSLDIDEQIYLVRSMNYNDGVFSAIGKSLTNQVEDFRFGMDNILFEDLPEGQQRDILRREFRSGGMMVVHGGKAILLKAVEGAFYPFVIGPWNTAEKLLDGGYEDLSATEMVSLYADGLVPVFVYGTAKSLMKLQNPTGWVKYGKYVFYPISSIWDFGRSNYKSLAGTGVTNEKLLHGLIADKKLAVKHFYKLQETRARRLKSHPLLSGAVIGDDYRKLLSIRKAQRDLAAGHYLSDWEFHKVKDKVRSLLWEGSVTVGGNEFDPHEGTTFSNITALEDEALKIEKNIKNLKSMPKSERDNLKAKMDATKSSTDTTKADADTVKVSVDAAKPVDATVKTTTKDEADKAVTSDADFEKLSDPEKIKKLHELDSELITKIDALSSRERSLLERMSIRKKSKISSDDLRRLHEDSKIDLATLYQKRVDFTLKYIASRPDKSVGIAENLESNHLFLDEDILDHLKISKAGLAPQMYKKGALASAISASKLDIPPKLRLLKSFGKSALAVGVFLALGSLAGYASAETSTGDTSLAAGFKKSKEEEEKKNSEIGGLTDAELATEAEMLDKLFMQYSLDYNAYLATITQPAALSDMLEQGIDQESIKDISDLEKFSFHRTVSFVNNFAANHEKISADVMRLSTANADVLNEIFRRDPELQKNGKSIGGYLLKLKWDKENEKVYLQYADQEEFVDYSYMAIDQTFSWGMGWEVGGNFIPFAGSIRDLYRGWRNLERGNNWQAFKDYMWGAGGLLLDVVTFGEGSLVKGGIKMIVKGASKADKVMSAIQVGKTGRIAGKYLQVGNLAMDASEISYGLGKGLESYWNNTDPDTFTGKYYAESFETAQDIPFSNPGVVRMSKRPVVSGPKEAVASEIDARFESIMGSFYWKNAEWEVLDANNILVIRTTSDNTVKISRDSEGIWNLDGALAADGGYKTVEQAFVMANLSNDTMEWLDEPASVAGVEYDKVGASDNPFYVSSGGDIEFDLDWSPVAIDYFINGSKWLDTYERSFDIPNDWIVNLLNRTYKKYLEKHSITGKIAELQKKLNSKKPE